MSLLEDLINKHCPDGVDYVPLWSVTIWDKKFNSVDKKKQNNTIKYKYYLADELKELIVENGNVKILTTNISNLFTLEKLVSDTLSYGEIVCIPWGGNPIVQYYKGKFITSDNRIATSIDVNKLDNKFLYYVLINKLDLISSFYRGAGIKHPDMSKVLDIIIPLPPIEVQKEIVRILDIFTEYQDLLNRELILRKKQYEYYRDKLLTFGDDVEWKYLGEILQPKGYIRGPFGSALKKDFFVKDGVPIYEQQHAIYNKRVFRYFVDYEKANKLKRFTVKPYDIIISCSGTIGKISIIMPQDPIGVINQALLILRLDLSKVNVKYIKYYFECFSNLIVTSSGGAITNIEKREIIEKIKIPVPPLKEQEQIVKILDSFDTLCNDITRGLPAEIDMRKKQYEYYRDKLLTFKEKKK